tara:strand:+ start:19934 stop:22033 length:2100 start_codon:yes stop_codon:yes gene_type:complete
MAQVINTNIASLNAQRNLNSSQAGTNQALERLSSGLRINSAKDDAAGLAISTRFESQIKGLNVAIRNAGDGVSLAQTAEGSLGSMTESLQRVRELALQSANGTNSSADRQALQAEAKLLIEEIGRVSEGANFNGVNLLDGSLSTTFQVGANAGETIDVSIGKLTTDTLGVSEKNGVTASATDVGLSTGDLTINGVAVGASKASDDSASTAGQAASAISKAAAINAVSEQSGVTAVVDTNTVAGTSMTGAAASGSVTINGTAITLTTTTDTAATRTAVVEAINAESGLTGVTAIDTGDDTQGVQLVAADGRNIEVTLATVTAAGTGLAASGTYEGGVTLVANAGVNEITIGGNATANAGLTAGTYTSSVAATSTEARTQATTVAPDTLVAGDMVINGVAIGAAVATDDTSSVAAATSSAKEASSISIAAAINRSSAETGVEAIVNENVVSGTSAAVADTAGDAGDLVLNGQTITLTVGASLEASRTAAVAAINAVSGTTGVVATDTGTGLSLAAADGRNIVMAFDNTDTDVDQFGIASSAVAEANGAPAATDGVTTYGTVTLQSAEKFTVSGGTNGNAELEALGFEAGTFGGAESGQFLKDVDLSTQKGATEALAAIDNALNSVNSARGDLGAVQNRFEATISNLEVNSENLSAANSRIRDADFAAEAANLARSQVLQQAGISILSQANASGQQVLSLLQ